MAVAYCSLFVILTGISFYLFHKNKWQMGSLSFMRGILIVLCLLSAIEPYNTYFFKGGMEGRVSEDVYSVLIFAFDTPAGWVNILYGLLLLLFYKLHINKLLSLKRLFLFGGLLHLVPFLAVFNSTLRGYGSVIVNHKLQITPQMHGRWDSEGGGILFFFIPYILITLISLGAGLAGLFSKEKSVITSK